MVTKTTWWVAGLLVAFVFSGCLAEPDPEPEPGSPDDPQDPEGSDQEPQAGRQTPTASTPRSNPAPLPPPIRDTRTVSVATDPSNVAGTDGCTLPTAGCFEYPFSLSSQAHINARLGWDLPVNDFDMYLYRDGQEVLNSGEAPPATEEGFSGNLARGSYVLVVKAWLVPHDTYTLEATFA